MSETSASIDLAWFNDQMAQYSASEKLYQGYAEVLRIALAQACQGIAPHAIVQVRAKSIPSFAEKILRKRHKYKDPVHQLTDLCGSRVIVHTKMEVERVRAFIRAHFDIDEENSLDAAALLRPSEFGYQSVHHVVQLRPGQFTTERIPAGVLENICGLKLKAEIQVRTIAQHCWADIGHDRIYKSPFPVPDNWRRESARIAALLEQVDDGFAHMTEGVDGYRAPGADNPYMAPEKVDEEISLLESVLGCCPDNVSLAHRLARLLISKERWDSVVDCLKPHENSKDPATLFCLGFALCQQNKENPRSDGFVEGRDFLDQAVQANPKHVEALLASAEACRVSDEDQARERYLQAFSIAPSDPRALAAYVRLKVAEERTLSFVPLIRSSLENAIARCWDQTAVGLNLPSALYSIGEFSLLLGRPYESLAAYVQAVQRSDSEFMIDTALETVDRLRVLREREAKWAVHLDWVRRFLLLAKGAKFHDGALDSRLKELASNGLTITGPVVILAGGCDLNVQARMAGYGRLLKEAFRDFRGTIISGGTRAGIGGLVGELMEAYPGQFYALGYVPGLMPADVEIDRRYTRVLKTDGNDFSAQEPLHNWIDLLAGGIAPSRVKLLGINGGEIAAFEYRLAAALGAQVGLLRGSGREADALIQTSELVGRCLALPDDLHTVRLFVRHGMPSPLTPEEREQLGEAIHRRYLINERVRLEFPDPSRKNWPELPDHLKESNRQQADYHQELLRAVTMTTERVAEGEIDLIDLRPDEIELMAEIEHARSNVERLLAGWTLGPRDPERKRSPYLVPWADLPEPVKEWDRQAVRAIPETLKQIGLKIRRLAADTS